MMFLRKLLEKGFFFIMGGMWENTYIYIYIIFFEGRGGYETFLKLFVGVRYYLIFFFFEGEYENILNVLGRYENFSHFVRKTLTPVPSKHMEDP